MQWTSKSPVYKNVLRELAAGAEDIDERTVTVSELLRRIGLDDPLYDARKHLELAQLMTAAGRYGLAARQVNLAEAKLGALLDV